MRKQVVQVLVRRQDSRVQAKGDREQGPLIVDPLNVRACVLLITRKRSDRWGRDQGATLEVINRTGREQDPEGGPVGKRMARVGNVKSCGSS